MGGWGLYAVRGRWDADLILDACCLRRVPLDQPAQSVGEPIAAHRPSRSLGTRTSTWPTLTVAHCAPSGRGGSAKSRRPAKGAPTHPSPAREEGGVCPGPAQPLPSVRHCVDLEDQTCSPSVWGAEFSFGPANATGFHSTEPPLSRLLMTP